MHTPTPHYRQFLVGPRVLPALNGWHVIALGDGLVAHIHPALQHEHLERGTCMLLLLGYMIDAHHPERDNTEILRDIATCSSPEEILAITSRLAGRWALLVAFGDRRLVIHDACGMRQVAYSTAATSESWIASDPRLIAKAQDLAVSPELDSLVSSLRRRNQEAYYLPGASALYDKVAYLLPNHYLDMGARQQIRFYPRGRLPEIGLEDAAARICQLLHNIIDGLFARYPLALALTGGIDSRVLLAASRRRAKDIFIYTVSHRPRREKAEDMHSEPDIALAGQLMRHLALPHHVIPAGDSDETRLRSVLQEHTALPHDFNAAWIAGLLAKYPLHHITMNGACSEVIRTKWDRRSNPARWTGKRLADEFWDAGGHAAACRALDSWLDGARSAAMQSGIEVLDLAHWELKLGRWLSQLLLEQDLAAETVSPFNCREVLEIGLSVDWQSRSYSTNYALHRRFIEKMWPACLDIPIGPAPHNLRRYILTILKVHRFKQLLWRIE